MVSQQKQNNNEAYFNIDTFGLVLGQSKSDSDTLNANLNYDKELASKLGGNNYGMKSYFLVILKTGTNQTTDNDFINKSFRG